MKAPKVERIKGGWAVRLRCGKGQHQRFRILLANERAAAERAQRMAELAHQMVAAGRVDEAPILLRKAGVQATEAGMLEVEAYARELCGQAKAAKRAAQELTTFRQLAEHWTNGKLARQHPDHVKLKRSVETDAQRLKLLCNTIGDVPLRAFGLDDAKRAMAAIPEGRTPATRRHYGQLIARLLKMAVFPCELIDRYPLPPGFLPKVGPRPALSYLYPAEDERLLSCTLVPFPLRLLYGFLAREGLRLGEALELCWQHLDLKHGTVRLERTKTGETRAWALDSDVALALTAVREARASEDASALVFPLLGDKPAATFRAYLRTAGVSRPELFERTPHRRPIRLHDQRASFCTLALAGGRPEVWVMDRTGHTTSAMLSKYRRQSRHAAELGLGWLKPLSEALPELAEVCRDLCSSAGGGNPVEPATPRNSDALLGTPGRIRTYDQRIRNPLLYPAELRAQRRCRCQIKRLFSATCATASSAAAHPKCFPSGCARRRTALPTLHPVG